MVLEKAPDQNMVKILKIKINFMKIFFIYVTFNSVKEAKILGKQLVKNKLAACTNIIPKIYSIYSWKNKEMTETECSMIVKTSKLKLKKAINFIIKKHSYECPAVSSFSINSANPDFVKWINQQTKN